MFRDGYQGVQSVSASRLMRGARHRPMPSGRGLMWTPLPAAPPTDWVPEVPRDEWAERLVPDAADASSASGSMCFEPNMRGWRQGPKAQGGVLEVLSSYAMRFQPAERREAVRHLFGVKGLLDGVDGDMFDFLLCKVDPMVRACAVQGRAMI